MALHFNTGCYPKIYNGGATRAERRAKYQALKREIENDCRAASQRPSKKGTNTLKQWQFIAYQVSRSTGSR